MRRSRARLPSGALVAVLVAVASGCGYYSFTGASIPSQYRTIAVVQSVDNSVSTLNTMDQDLTELLLERFVRQTRLILEPDELQADLVLVTTIDRFANAPTAVGGDERAGLNRVTISVSAVYRDRAGGEDLLNRAFSAFEEYDPAGDSGLEGEEVAARAVLQQIADDIFTAATSNW